MTVELLTSLTAAGLSLLFGLVPPFKQWYDKKTDAGKSWIMIGLLIATAGIIAGINCAGWASGLEVPVVECTEAGFLFLGKLLFQAIVVNQGVYLLTRNITHKRS